MLNARQFGLKLLANVTYGYTAASFSGRMPCAELADAIVQVIEVNVGGGCDFGNFHDCLYYGDDEDDDDDDDEIMQSGRESLEMCIFKANNWHKSSASSAGALQPRPELRVVYGDTDSMFVQVLPKAHSLPRQQQQQQQEQQQRQLHDAFDRMRVFARVCNAALPNPMELELEKIFFPCILATKKRYVGMAFESSKQTEGFFDAKGIESVRRDTCPLVQVRKQLNLTPRTSSLVQLDACSLTAAERDGAFAAPALCHARSERRAAAGRGYVDFFVLCNFVISSPDTFCRLLRGEVPLQELAFAKEVRMGTYAYLTLPYKTCEALYSLIG
jgi:hypothetical protein